MTRAGAIVLVAFAALAAACSKQDDAPAAAAPVLAEAEVQRGLDACNAYVAQVCACQADAAIEACKLAKALPEAIEVAKQLALNPKADREDAYQAALSVRKTVEHCIEQTAQLPALGCS